MGHWEWRALVLRSRAKKAVQGGCWPIPTQDGTRERTGSCAWSCQSCLVSMSSHSLVSLAAAPPLTVYSLAATACWLPQNGWHWCNGLSFLSWAWSLSRVAAQEFVGLWTAYLWWVASMLVWRPPSGQWLFLPSSVKGHGRALNEIKESLTRAYRRPSGSTPILAGQYPGWLHQITLRNLYNTLTFNYKLKIHVDMNRNIRTVRHHIINTTKKVHGITPVTHHNILLFRLILGHSLMQGWYYALKEDYVLLCKDVSKCIFLIVLQC